MGQSMSVEEATKACSCKRANILREHEDSNGQNIAFKFLVFGLSESGKSTFCNGVRSALRDEKRVSSYHQPGESGDTFTKEFQPAFYGPEKSLCMIDMPGIFEKKKISVEALDQIMRGRVSFKQTLDENLRPVESGNCDAEVSQQEISCVIIVMKPDTEVAENVQKLFDVVDKATGDGVISRHIVVTHLDKINKTCDTAPKKLASIIASDDAVKCCRDISRRTGVRLPDISLVRNYWKDKQTDVYTNLVYLELMENLIQIGKDTRERQIAKR